jgi:very-short-patch-repair endonuclease
MRRPNVDRARALRVGQTDAERALWRRLRNRLLLGWKFRRQHEVGPYIGDFVCTDAWLIVELDGGQHVDRAADDAQRTHWLEQEGYRVLRFWNDDVLKKVDDVLEQIVRALPVTPPHPGPLPGGEREKSA